MLQVSLVSLLIVFIPTMIAAQDFDESALNNVLQQCSISDRLFDSIIELNDFLARIERDISSVENYAELQGRINSLLIFDPSSKQENESRLSALMTAQESTKKVIRQQIVEKINSYDRLVSLLAKCVWRPSQ